MSQKERSFQSKPRSGGQKFGGRDEGRRNHKGRGRERPEGSGFSKRSEGDRGPRAERPAGRPFDRNSRPPRRDRDDSRGEGRRDFRSDNRGDSRPEGRRDFDRDSRPARSPRPSQGRDRSFGDNPYKKREFSGGGEGRRDFKSEGRGDFKSEGRRDYKPEGRRDFKSEGRRDFGSRPPRDRDFGDKPYKKREFGDKKPFNKEKRYSDRPQKSFERYDDRPAKREFNPEAHQKLKSDRPSYGAPSSAYLYGIHAVTQALLNPKRIHQRLLCTSKGFESLREAWQDAQSDGIALPEVITVEKEDLERLLPRDAVHQDVLLDCQPLEEIFLADILTNIPDNAKILVLDQVTDPHNVGAILRSAAAFGALAVVMQKLHAPETTGTLAKSASGAVEHVPLIREVNLSRALEQLKEAGFFCIGLAEEGKQPLAKLNLTGKTALVLGAEGSGLRRLVAENCDELAKLPTQEPIASLNVSNAAAIALYELIRAA